MANTLLALGGQAILGAGIDLDSVDLRIVLVSSGHTPNDATDDFLDDISSGNRLAISAQLGSVSVANGRLTSAAAAFSGGSITTGTAVNAYLYNNTPGTEAGKHLIARIDTRAGPTALSWSVQSGVDATLTPDATTGWFKISNNA